MSRFFRVYLLAIALPAALLAVFGARLLAQGSAWQRRQAAEGAAMRAENAAREIADGVRALAGERLDRVAAAPDAAARVAVLRAMAERDPLVRDAFLWRAGEGFVFRSRTEVAGLSFPAALPWTGGGGDAAPAAARGLHPWSSGDRPELLAWVRTEPGEVAGFAFETVAWLARFCAAPPPAGGSWGRTSAPVLSVTLVDETGAEIAPPAAEPAPGAPAGEASLAPLFPSWRVRAAPAAGAAGGARFAQLGGVLLGLLLCSLVAGGAVLLRAARRERRDALRKTEFVSNVSHELRTPLTSIRMFSELLAEDRIPDPARRRRALGTVAAESARLSRLVDGILDFSRLERNRRKYSIGRLDLAALLAEMADDRSAAREDSAPAQAEPAHRAFRIAHCEDGATALADRDAVRQIVLNLLDNAAKYAAAGGPPDVTVRDAGNCTVALAVLDRGPGVPPRAAKKIFDRFYRVDDSTTRETGGNGLGLSIARRLARGMGGDLVYRPRTGGGAVFELTLPAAT